MRSRPRVCLDPANRLREASSDAFELLSTVPITPIYEALEKFEAILYDRDLWWQPLLQSGDLLIIDNHRILHGREAFDPGAGERHLQCCNVDRDDFHNNYRRIAKSFGSVKWDRRLSFGVI